MPSSTLRPISIDRARRDLSIDIDLHIGECVWANPFTFYKISFNFSHLFLRFFGIFRWMEMNFDIKMVLLGQSLSRSTWSLSWRVHWAESFQEILES